MDQNTLSTIGTVLMWFGTAVFSLLSLIGVAKLIEIVVTRYFRRKDKQEHVHEANQEHQLHADADYRKDLIKRVEKLEEDQRKTYEQLLSQAVANKELTVINENLKEKNTKQGEQIERLRSETKTLRDANERLQHDLYGTRIELNDAVHRIDSLTKDIDRLKVDHAVEIEKEVLRRLAKAKETASTSIQVALIENNADCLELLELEFKHAGVTTISFSTGETAVEWFQQNRARAVIIDLAMGDPLDGLTIIQKIRGFERIGDAAPAMIFIYTGQLIDDAIQSVIDSQNVTAVFQKGTHPPDTVVAAVNLILGGSAEQKYR